MVKMRKPIQVVLVNNAMVVLANDGTLWTMSGAGEWIQAPELPQPVVKPSNKPRDPDLDSEPDDLDKEEVWRIRDRIGVILEGENQMSEKIKEFVLQTLKNCRGDDLYRARSAFKGWPEEAMNRPYRQSDKTPRQILEEYEKAENKLNEAIKWVQGVK
jgi:hypothetical protein